MIDLLVDIYKLCVERMFQTDALVLFFYFYFYSIFQMIALVDKKFNERLAKRSAIGVVILVFLFWPSILLRDLIDKVVWLVVKINKPLRIACKNIRRIIRKKKRALGRKLVIYFERK